MHEVGRRATGGPLPRAVQVGTAQREGEYLVPMGVCAGAAWA